MFEELKQFGLSENAVSVYTSLIKLGHATVGPIISELGCTRQSVYNAIEELERKGLVKKTLKNKVSYYFPNDPTYYR